ncbi:putative glycosyl hydrolase 1 family protein [Lyophyllum shimeji]|uniref:Glycosyl hydrolase 1 family protein n=1 Tax=Lyophyllum shimeji TaxID=47721 RepID=A0A9P3UPR2_LYOSH|nr:putative glycosyl hydrolase 1 family protein [Lyophyllum shimeji]
MDDNCRRTVLSPARVEVGRSQSRSGSCGFADNSPRENMIDGGHPFTNIRCSEHFHRLTWKSKYAGGQANVGREFPTRGSIPRDYSPAGLDRLWKVVGPVEAPHSLPLGFPNSPLPFLLLPRLSIQLGFKFGVATASYQVEGAVKNEGKGPTMWDWNSRQPGGVLDNTTGDIVDLQYFLYKEDVARVAALGLNAHSFSILPFGTADSPVNQAGLDHYSDLIDYHIKFGVEPVVTLFHWDLPLAIQAYYGGFTSPKVVDDFLRQDGLQGLQWSRQNLVYVQRTRGYYTTLAPGVNSSTAPYHCSYNLLKAHAGAVKAFREMKIQGEISFKNDDFVGIPWRANNTDDIAAVERHAAFRIGVFSDPTYTTGDWPKILTDTLPPSYLPRFNESEKKDILGSADFFAIDAYRTSWIAAPPTAWRPASTTSPTPCGPNVTRRSFTTRTLGGRAARILIHCSMPGSNPRLTTTNYYMTYLGEILRAIHEDKLPIAGTFAWAMLDNAEWNSGMIARCVYHDQLETESGLLWLTFHVGSNTACELHYPGKNIQTIALSLPNSTRLMRKFESPLRMILVGKKMYSARSHFSNTSVLVARNFS